VGWDWVIERLELGDGVMGVIAVRLHQITRSSDPLTN
jgi:hypothetical protein